MKAPPTILLTALKLPGRPESPLAVRSDIVLVVERAEVKIEEKPVPGVKVTKLPGNGHTEGTCLHVAGGGSFFVQESVEEVHGKLRAARSWWPK